MVRAMTAGVAERSRSGKVDGATRQDARPIQLQRFIRGVEAVVQASTDSRTIVGKIEPLLKELVRDKNWLDPKYMEPIPSKAYAQYLLYRAPDSSFSIVSFVWNPFQGSPLHDHGVWGVIGQYQGIEEELRYRRSPSGKIDRIGVAKAKPGAVSHVFPPERDIHQIRNQTRRPTVSIHVYGCDIGTHQRHTFDPKTGEMKNFVSGYDQISATTVDVRR